MTSTTNVLCFRGGCTNEDDEEEAREQRRRAREERKKLKDLEEPGADDVINTDRYKWDGRNIKVGFGKLGDSD